MYEIEAGGTNAGLETIEPVQSRAFAVTDIEFLVNGIELCEVGMIKHWMQKVNEKPKGFNSVAVRGKVGEAPI